MAGGGRRAMGGSGSAACCVQRAGSRGRGWQVVGAARRVKVVLSTWFLTAKRFSYLPILIFKVGLTKLRMMSQMNTRSTKRSIKNTGFCGIGVGGVRGCGEGSGRRAGEQQERECGVAVVWSNSLVVAAAVVATAVVVAVVVVVVLVVAVRRQLAP